MSIINENEIKTILEQKATVDKVKIQEILDKAQGLCGLSIDDVATLLHIDNSDHRSLELLFEAANNVKNEIYGKRLVLFSPLYLSNICQNECLYCAFRAQNDHLTRKTLTQDELTLEVQSLLEQGHKRILFVSGEDLRPKSFDYFLESLESIYKVKDSRGHSIRRVNVNLAPLSVEDFKRLSEYSIGTYQLFQETYHLESYEKYHLKGPKKDYLYRLQAMDRAFEGGLEDIGIGVLFGLYDYKFEVLALLSHIKHLEKTFGVGPHTISVPRLEPAFNSSLSTTTPWAVSDEDFLKIIAILRLAVPYTGLILSTREKASLRRKAFQLGISQISAGSKTSPGGYQAKDKGRERFEQFSLGDHRSLHEVLSDLVDEGYIPSFCTGCYRKGRVGADFMDLAKPGLIKSFCFPNALFSFAEYLYDFADSSLKEKGLSLIHQMAKDHSCATFKKLEEIEKGKRDIYL